MALSFLYLAFFRMLELLRLLRRNERQLAIEVDMLRHEVVVLRRQVGRQPCRCLPITGPLGDPARPTDQAQICCCEDTGSDACIGDEVTVRDGIDKCLIVDVVLLGVCT